MSPVIKVPDMPPLMAGTAGHVDHGKSALVKLLTGCETDNLREEKERGLSIELGFAPCRMSGNKMIGIIDVPGHIDFIRNMVAGAASIDILILVIAADDGVMPQTVEHMQIIKLLRAPKVVVALTKKDLVDDDMLELARDDVQDFMTGMGYPEAPIIPVSNITLEGISTLRDTLDSFVEEFKWTTSQQAFRLNIKRFFSVKGYGTVVTGVPVSGHAATGDTLELFPGGRKVRLRTVQNYKFDRDTAQASVCCALNISDVKIEDIHRGMTLGEPGYFSDISSCLVTLDNISDAITVKHNSDYKFHIGTSETKAKVKLLEANSLVPKEQTVARLLFESPVVTAAGDKFIIRSMSPSVTVAGGCVISCDDHAFKRSNKLIINRLLKSSRLIGEGQLLQAALLAGASPIIDLSAFIKTSKLAKEESLKKISTFVDEQFLIAVDADHWLVAERLSEVANSLINELKRYHTSHPYTWGMSRAEVGILLKIDPDKGRGFMTELVKTTPNLKAIHGRIALKEFTPPLSKQQMEQKEKMESMIIDAGCNAVSVNSITEALALKKADFKLLNKILLEEGFIITLGKHFMHKPAFAHCIQAVDDCFKEKDNLEVNDFRSKIGVGRNIAVAILEKMDELNITGRTDAGRILVKREK